MPDGIENPSFLESFVDEPLRFGLNRVDLTAVKVPVSETGLVGVCLRWHRTVHRIMQLKTHPEVEDEKLARLYQQISKSFGVMFDALDRYEYDLPSG